MVNHKIISIVIILYLAVQGNSYPASCKLIDQLTNQDLWNLFQYSSFDIYFTFSVGSLSIVFIVIALLTWIPHRTFVMPADIVFIVLSASLLAIICQLIQVIYYVNNQGESVPDSFEQFCSSLGFFSMFGDIVSLYYNAFFCISLAYSIQHTLRKPMINQIKSHFLCLIAVLMAILIIIFTSDSKKPLHGMCIYEITNQTSLGLFLFHLIIFVICLYSLIKFKSKIPKNTYFQQQSHFGYYYVYMIIFSGVQVVNSILYLIGKISCQIEVNNLFSILKILQTITRVIAILLTFATVTLRLSHPLFIIKAKMFFKIRLLPNQQDIQEEQLSWINSLVQSIKGSQILSYIEAIMVNYIEHYSKQPPKLTPYHFQRQYSFLLNEDIAEDYIRRRITNRDSHFARQLSAGLRTLTYEVLIYTPEFYSWQFKAQHLDLFQSFDIRKNLSIVKQQSYTQGGKSGQFFFGTFDNKYIFKTIQPEEADVYLNKTQQFYKYFCDNPDSLLIKIMGLYRFTRKDIAQQSVYLILMKNCTMSPKKYNLRVYDIKGSQFNRSALRLKSLSAEDDSQLRRLTLKDKDFLVIEKKIQIDGQKAAKLKRILTRDIQFLGTMGVMDYSVLIIKRQGPPTYQHGQYQSTKEPGIYYNFGIIDYLEEWTLMRKAERAFKTLITNQQVTANPPLNYSSRLIGFLNQII